MMGFQPLGNTAWLIRPNPIEAAEHVRMGGDDENEGRVGKCDREVTRTRRLESLRYGRGGTRLTFCFLRAART